MVYKNKTNDKKSRGRQDKFRGNPIIIDEITHYGAKAQLLLTGIDLLPKDLSSKYSRLTTLLEKINKLMKPEMNLYEREEALSTFRKEGLNRILTPENFVKIMEQIVDDLINYRKNVSDDHGKPIDSYLASVAITLNIERSKL